MKSIETAEIGFRMKPACILKRKSRKVVLKIISSEIDITLTFILTKIVIHQTSGNIDYI